MATQVTKENMGSNSNTPASSNIQQTEILVEPPTKRLYTGDIVTSKRINASDENLRLGTVIPGSTESEINRSQDGGSSSEVYVHWDSENKLGVSNVNDISLVDRMLTRGQRVKSETGLCGTVINFNNKATLNIVGTNHVIEDISLDRLRPISAFVRGQEVLYLDWVGIIINIKRNVWFRMDGGKTFFLETNETDGFMKNDPYWGIAVSCPGVRTHFSPVILKQAKWPGSTMRFFWKYVPFLPYWYSYSSALITRTEVIQLTVKWLHIAPYKKTLVPSLMPPTILEQNQLRFVELIGAPSTETIGFNSVRIFRLKPDDCMTSHAMWLEKFRKNFMDISDGSRKIVNYTPPFSLQQNDNGYDLPVKVLLRQNEVEIEWDDESKSIMLSADVPYINRPVDDTDYPSGLIVAPVHKDVANSEQYGIVQNSESSVLAKKKTVFVRWIHIDSRQIVSDFGIHEESVYDIKPHPRYSLYIRSTIVFAKIPVREKFRAGTVIDIDVRAGKMIILNPSDNTTHHVYPHVVTPMAQRCFWNFFYKKWEEDVLIPPAHQLEMENDPEKNITDTTSEILLDSLFTDNNNLGNNFEETSIWDHPSFELLPEAPTNHRFYEFNKEIYSPGFGHNFAQEHQILKDHVPEGIWIRLFENRMDLVSVLLLGPTKTPYEDGLILFDMQLPANFPLSRPKVKYISYASADISPLLSSDGNFCFGCTKWEPVPVPNEENNSNIISFVSQIQSLIFSAEPYYSGKRDRLNVNDEASVAYNESVVISMMDSTFNMMHKPWAPFEQLIRSHFTANLPDRLKLGKALLGKTEEDLLLRQELGDCGFPLNPMSTGFEIALASRLTQMQQYVEALKLEPNDTIGCQEKSSVSSRHLDLIEEESTIGSVSNIHISEVNEVKQTSSRDTMKNFLNNMTVAPPKVLDCVDDENIDIPVPILPEDSTAE